MRFYIPMVVASTILYCTLLIIIYRQLKKEKKDIPSKLKKILNLDSAAVSLITLLICGLLSLVTYNVAALNPLKRVLDDFSMTDIYSHILHGNGAHEVSNDIVIVDMTSQTKRTDLARTIKNIAKCEPKVTVLDIIFENPTYLEEDTAIIGAIDELDTMVLASKLINYDPETEEFRDMRVSFFLNEDKNNWGYGNTTAGNQSNYIREYTTWQKCKGKVIYSMPYLAACLYQGVAPKKEETVFTQILYNDKDFLIIPADSVLQRAKFLKDRIVYLGAMYEEADMHFTPIGKLAGVKVQAFATQTILEHKSIRRMSTPTCIIFTFFLCYISTIIVGRIRRRATAFDTKLSERHPAMFPMDLQLDRVRRVVNIYYLLLPVLLVFVSFVLFVIFGYVVQLLLPLAGIALCETVKYYYICFKPVVLNFKK